MASNVSIGVFSTLTDLSQYVQAIPGTIGYIAFISEKGPDNVVVGTNGRDFFTDFGRPNINYTGSSAYGMGPYVASKFLSQSDSLFVSRVLPADAAYANVSIFADTTSAAVDATSSIAVSTTALLDSAFTSKPEQCVTFYGTGRGEYYNDYRFILEAHTNSSKASDGYYILEIQKKLDTVDPETGADRWVNSAGPFEVSFDPNELDDTGESAWIVDVVNAYSPDVKAKGDADACKAAINASVDFSTGSAFANGVQLQFGSSGTLFDVDNKLSTTVATQILSQAYGGTLLKPDGTTFMTEVRDVENYLFSVLFDAGYPKDVKDKIVDMATTRDDCIAIVDNGDNFSVADSTTERTTNQTYSSKNVMLVDIYSRVYDQFTGRDIWVPPTYHVAKLITYTDKIANVHTSFAGPNRGILNDIKEVRYTPLLSDRDTLYLNQINPIVAMNIGTMLWDQLTSQKRPSKLQQVHIVRLYLYIKRALTNYTIYYVHEKNDAEEYDKISRDITDFLNEIQNERGLYGFSVDVGANEYDQKRGNVKASVILDPTNIIRQVHMDFFIK